MPPGPIPNREADLSRPRERRGPHVVPVTKGTMLPTEVPEPDPDWHPISTMLWEGLVTSGQREFYQNSDWAYAWHICEELSIYKRQTRRSAQMLASIMSAMGSLLVTEGDRRRVRIELTEPAPVEDEATVAVMDNYRSGLKLVQ